MASRLILKNNIKAPIHFLLRNPASSAPLTQTIIQNLVAPIPTQFAVESSRLFDPTPLSRDSMPRFDGGVRIEVREKRPERFEDADEMIESGSDVEDPDEFGSDYDEESGGDFYDDDDAEPRDDEV